MPTALQSVAHALLRLLVVVAGALLALFALAMGLVLGLGLMLWALLRGRKPVLAGSLRWPQRRPPSGEVVDVEAHEVADPAARRLP